VPVSPPNPSSAGDRRPGPTAANPPPGAVGGADRASVRHVVQVRSPSTARGTPRVCPGPESCEPGGCRPAGAARAGPPGRSGPPGPPGRSGAARPRAAGRAGPGGRWGPAPAPTRAQAQERTPAQRRTPAQGRTPVPVRPRPGVRRPTAAPRACSCARRCCPRHSLPLGSRGGHAPSEAGRIPSEEASTGGAEFLSGSARGRRVPGGQGHLAGRTHRLDRGPSSVIRCLPEGLMHEIRPFRGRKPAPGRGLGRSATGRDHVEQHRQPLLGGVRDGPGTRASATPAGSVLITGRPGDAGADRVDVEQKPGRTRPAAACRSLLRAAERTCHRLVTPAPSAASADAAVARRRSPPHGVAQCRWGWSDRPRRSPDDAVRIRLVPPGRRGRPAPCSP
jgi:hypothetical protein